MVIYKVAADILNKIESKKGSVKSLVIGAKYKNTKQLYALVVETLKYKDVLQEIISKMKITQLEKGLSENEAMVLVYDFLFGRGIQCGGRYKKIIYSRKSQLKSTLALIKVNRKVSSNKDLIKKDIKDVQKLPKYLRVNTLLTTKKDVIEYFCRSGFSLVTSRDLSVLKKNEFMIDCTVPDLLVFHPSIDLHDDRLYKAGEIIFQDKASCLPAFILSPPQGSTVIDACAAPGNKTSHLAAIMSNKGKIFAFDISPRRLSTMETLLLKAGTLCCETKQQDFLQVDPSDTKYKDVRFILLDPSCSGSGIVNRLNYLTDDDNSVSEQRIQSLAKFQLRALLHALNFSKVEKVVYSTCSIHTTENEGVIQKALVANNCFELVHVLPEWKNRGVVLEGFENEAEKCIRCNPKTNFTNGFFIALLQRIPK